MKRHVVAALANPPVSIFELGCVIEVFGRDRPDPASSRYELTIGAMGPGPVPSTGIAVHVEHGPEQLARADTIIIPGWDIGVLASEELLDLLRAAHGRGVRLLSICSGAFLLAQAGLLDGLRATTHWLYAEELRQRYPMIRVDPDVLYVDEGDIITAAGSAAGLDMMLHVIRRDHGAAYCNAIARRLNIPPWRNGEQSQFALRPVPPIRDSRLTEAIAWMRENVTEDLSIEVLAQRAAMSTRTFFRKFREVTGQTPLDWLIGERIAVAKELLETGQLTMDQVAFAAGFSAPDMLRRHFKRLAGCTPADYRRTFGPSNRMNHMEIAA